MKINPLMDIADPCPWNQFDYRSSAVLVMPQCFGSQADL